MQNQQANLSDYAEAFRSTKSAKNLLWWLILLAIVIQLTGFAMVEFGGVLDYSKGQDPSTIAAIDAEDNTEQSQRTAICYDFLHWTLPATKFVAVVSAMLLAVILLLAVKVSLVGRLGGAGNLVAAFLWSLLLLAAVTPWQQVFQGSFASGALFNLGNLVDQASRVKESWGAASPSTLSRVLYYARFIAFPAVALLVLLTVQCRFARGYRATGLAGVETATPPAESPGQDQG